MHNRHPPHGLLHYKIKTGELDRIIWVSGDWAPKWGNKRFNLIGEFWYFEIEG